ncbi:MAG: DEAD/DEAH box helicase family protein [Candidatus Peribacteraceae bacterium]|nr:DEAD/DEAH box helicase family protein [Candidatus Peribacteraceae bacterium]
MSDFDVEIFKINATHLQVICRFDSDYRSLSEFFRFKDPTFSPNPYSRWDGYVRLFNVDKHTLPVGLLSNLVLFCKEYGLSFHIDEAMLPFSNPISMPDVEEWIEGLNLSREKDDGSYVKMEAYDFQIDALFYAMKYGRYTPLAATSGGKSLIIYMLIRLYEEMGLTQDNGKILIIVPSVSLVNQMFDNFIEYSQFNKWNTYINVHCIAEGASKFTSKPVIVSTWQAIQDEDKEYFLDFQAIVCDEVHLASAKKITRIVESSINAHSRVGMTGTLKNVNIHNLQVQGLFGPIQRIVTAKELQDDGRAARTDVTMVTLNYPEKDRHELAVIKRIKPKKGEPKTNPYQKEIEYIISHKGRMKFLIEMAIGLKGNILMLFDRKDKHLHVVADLLRKMETKKKIHVIIGEVDGDERDEIKRYTELNDGVIILATYGTMSTGESVNRLHYLIFAHPSKSIIRVLQSLGRLMRLHETKDVAKIIDIVDDLRQPGQRENYCIEHAVERFGFYREEQHKVKMKKITLEGSTHKLV